MPRKRIGNEPLSNAEKQRRYREKKKAQGERRAWTNPGIAPNAPDLAAVREQIKAELKASWEPELKAERIAAQRKRGRELARKADKSHDQGRIIGICMSADFFIGKDRADIARALLDHFMVDREQAAAALEADRRTKSLTLASLDKARAWGKPPTAIK